jgi:hypothetical protein
MKIRLQSNLLANRKALNYTQKASLHKNPMKKSLVLVIIIGLLALGICFHEMPSANSSMNHSIQASESHDCCDISYNMHHLSLEAIIFNLIILTPSLIPLIALIFGIILIKKLEHPSYPNRNLLKVFNKGIFQLE